MLYLLSTIYISTPYLCTVSTYLLSTYQPYPLPLCCTYPYLYAVHTPTSMLYIPLPLCCIYPYLCAVHTPTSMLYIPLPLCCTYPYLSAVGHVEVVVGPVQLRHVVLRPGRRGAQSSPAT